LRSLEQAIGDARLELATAKSDHQRDIMRLQSKHDDEKVSFIYIFTSEVLILGQIFSLFKRTL
jgi:hypothetical protein